MNRKFSLLVALALLAAANQAAAVAITSTNDANILKNALLGSGVGTGISVTSSSLNGHSGGWHVDGADENNPGTVSERINASSSGTFTNNSGILMSSGIVLSTGDVADYNGPAGNSTTGNTTMFGAEPVFDAIQDDWVGGVAATAAQDALIDPISSDPNEDNYDVTEFDIIFDADPDTNNIYFQIAFGSDEFPEFINDGVNDSFGIFLNGVNIAFTNGDPISIEHPDMSPLLFNELDGFLAPNGNPILTFSGAVTAGSTGNTLKFILGDVGDPHVDTTVYISALGSDTPLTATPEPAGIALLGLGMLGMGFQRLRTRKLRNTHP